jgi:hypothetical protein
MLTYNHKSIHSVTKLTPADATKPKNELYVKVNSLLHKKHDRNYAELNINDKVKIHKKKDLKHKKKGFHFGHKIHVKLKIYLNHTDRTYLE